MDLSIVVGSCDKYSFLWDKFTKRFNDYWNLDVELKKYLISETVEFSGDTFETLKCEKVSYTECLKKSLENINTKYILWLQDDYFMVRTLHEQIILNCYELISNNENIIRVGIQPNSKYYTTKNHSNNFLKLSKNSQYTISMQSSIWDREKMLLFLNDSPNESPWQFEINGSQRLNKTKYDVFFYELKEDWYKEAMKKGKTTSEYYIK